MSSRTYGVETIPAHAAGTDALFFDPWISVDGTVSCARRRQEALYGADGLPKAKATFDKLNDHRAPRCSTQRFSSRLTGAETARMWRTRLAEL